MVRIVTSATAVAVLLALTVVAQGPGSSQQEKPFGGATDVAFANKLWKATDGYEAWKLTTEVYPGKSPHGKWLRLFSTWVTVDGKSYPIIVKDNYGGPEVTKEAIEKDRDKWLMAVTIMLQREPGYDKEDQNWFWAKYGKDGTIKKNPKGMLLAGRVAKGMDKGCISCHSQADGKDFLFSNDE